MFVSVLKQSFTAPLGLNADALPPPSLPFSFSFRSPLFSFPKWRFGFSATSTLDALLDKPNVTLEEVFDEEDLLQECKNQNSKLIDYLQQPRVLKRLLEHVVGTAVVGGVGGKDWEEKVWFK